MNNFPKFVKLVEVGPRDGLQNESKIVPTAIKLAFIQRLVAAGLTNIEVTSFVSPKWVPQLADHKEVYQGIHQASGLHYPVLVFNQQGLDNAITAGVKAIAVFSTPSELFCQRNANCSVAESLSRISEIIRVAQHHEINVRGYVSCVLGCPFQGDVKVMDVVALAKKLLDIGCYEVSLGDTIGIGSPGKTSFLLDEIVKNIPSHRIAVHFHDTYGQALANIYVALERGIHIVDSAVSGLGGCPYAAGATGNVATEDVLYMLNGLGIETGVDLMRLIEAGRFITNYLHRENRSKVSVAMK